MATSLADQLAQVQRIRAGQPRVVPVATLTGLLRGDPGASVEKARTLALQWLADHAKAHDLPAHAWNFEPFEIDAPGVPIAVTRLLDGGPAHPDGLDYWVGRLHFVDTAVPGRTWATEITVAHGNGKALFGLRHQCSVPPNDPGFFPGVPRIVRDVAEQIGLVQDGAAVTGGPRIVQSAIQMDELVALIESPNRRLPVFVATTPNDVEDPARVCIDVAYLASRSAGVAHTWILPAHWTFELSERWGKQWGVFNGSVRTYRPAFDPDVQSPRQHPLALADRIEWRPDGAKGFVSMLLRNAVEDSLNSLPTREQPISFVRVRQLAAERRLNRSIEANAPLQEQLDRALQQVTSLKDEIVMWEDENSRLELEQRQLKERIDAQAKEVHGLMSRVYMLEGALESQGKQQEVPYPSTYDEMEDWAGTYLSGRLLLHSRALRAVKSGEYEDVQQVYKALKLLAYEYRDSKMGVRDAHERFQRELVDAGLELSPSGSKTSLGGFDDTYFIKHRGHKQFLESHIKGGRGREPRYCLRIYFFFDTEENIVVVGWLPEHLENNLS